MTNEQQSFEEDSVSQEPDNSSSFPSEQDAGEDLLLIELDTLLNRPPSRRKRLIQIVLALAAFVVVLVTFWNVIVPGTPPAPPVHVQPTQPPPTFTIISNVNYETITINGQPQRGSVPLTIKMRSQPPYTITLDAPPFRTLTCRFPPPGPGTPNTFDPCLETGTFIASQQAAYVLDMLFTLANLPAAQQQQITALIPQAITMQQTLTAPAQSTIVTGLNADGTINARRVTGPLRASVFLVPVTQTYQGQQGTFCNSFVCVDDTGAPLPHASPSGHLWEVSTPVALRWRFTTASGQIVSDVTFPSNTMTNLSLSYDAATGWQIVPFPADEGSLSQQLTRLVCATGMQMLFVEQARYLSGEGWDEAILHDAGINGCELALTQNNTDEGHFLWRFGALLAVDARAHSTLPTLPIASPADLAAVEG